jgi:plasmid stabilization system protein ParE
VTEVRWSVEAKADLLRLHASLRRKAPRAASRAIALIRAAVPILRKMPLAGRAMDDPSGRRELVRPFGGGAYVLRYRIDAAGHVFVLRVWHSLENRF